MQTKEPTYEPVPNPDVLLVADIPAAKGHLLTFFVADHRMRQELLAACKNERLPVNNSF